MKILSRFKKRIAGFYDVMGRFILTLLFLVAFAVCNIININSNTGNYSRLLSVLLVGALLAAVSQMITERFLKGGKKRLFTMAGALILTILFYLFIIPDQTVARETLMLKTLVACFTLFMAFILIPSIKNTITFNQTFMAAFKAFFVALFFASILFGGISLIIAAIDNLLFPISEKAYMHSASIIYSLFAPLYFLSLIPLYPGAWGEKEENEEMEKLIACPKLLERLISYIIVPLTAVFTLILLIYIIINIGNEFWTNSLLEPMLVSYSVAVILVYILTGTLQNKPARLFKKIFPKVLIPIVLLQTIASIIKVGNLGLPHTRYYVILFGVFAIAAGVIFSIVSEKKNGFVIMILIVLSLISIIPPVDAFTVGRVYQTNLLKNILQRNSMLSNGKILQNPAVPDNDKILITLISDYIFRFDYAEDIKWVDEGSINYFDFYKTYGFEPKYSSEEPGGGEYYGIKLMLSSDSVIDVSEYEKAIPFRLEVHENSERNYSIAEIEKNGLLYKMDIKTEDENIYLNLTDQEKKKLISFDLTKIIEVLKAEGERNSELTLEKATFTESSQQVDIGLVVRSCTLEGSSGQIFYLDMEALILINIR